MVAGWQHRFASCEVSHMSVSAFVVEVPAAERLVGELRMRFDASCKLGAPAQITVLFPFLSADDIRRAPE
jgi:hypothetical protein